jgi:hypothetical protein
MPVVYLLNAADLRPAVCGDAPEFISPVVGHEKLFQLVHIDKTILGRHRGFDHRQIDKLFG